MRCLACGSVVTNGQQTCSHCYRSTLPSEQALDACLALLLIAACVGYFLEDRILALICLAAIACCAVWVIRLKRLQALRDLTVHDQRSLPTPPPSRFAEWVGPKLKWVRRALGRPGKEHGETRTEELRGGRRGV